VHQGRHIFIGGVDSAEAGPILAGDLGSTLDKGVTSLSLTVPGTVPIVELTSLLVGSLLIGSLVALRRKPRRSG
jgi:hypothetical protein